MNDNKTLNRLLLSTSLIAFLIISTLANAGSEIPASKLATEQSVIWSEASERTQLEQSAQPDLGYRFKLYRLNIDRLSQSILPATVVDQSNYNNLLARNGVLTTLPLVGGQLVTFLLFESSILPSRLATKYPSIKTFSGYQVSNPANKGRFDLTPQGFHAMFTLNGQRMFIDPSHDDRTLYRVYNGSQALALAQAKNRPFDSVIVFNNTSPLRTADISRLAPDYGSTLRSYRLAVSAAAEYTQFHGGTVELGLAAVTTAINRVNQVYENDLAIKLLLADNNDKLIYTDPDTDPFGNDIDDIYLNGFVIDDVVGNSNYDIGHIFNTAGGGLAGLGVVCGEYKAGGVTGMPNPTNDVFYIDYVAHEIGHQFGGNHTFNGGAGACGGNRSASAAYEPGSASTIMGYAGICGDQNIQSNSDAFFHSHSIDEIRTYITQSGGANCGTNSPLYNNIPTAEAGDSLSIPMLTPFILTGTGNDPDVDDLPNLTYSWEQLDLGSQTFDVNQMIDDGSRPLFRAFLPTSNESRIFPQLSRIIAGTSSMDEVLPTTSRTMNFRLTVRDGRGGVSMDTTSVYVDNTAGPFIVTSPSAGLTLIGGVPLITEWDVANTDAGVVNCDAVDISLSDDGGLTFSQILLENTPNDGSQEVVIPNLYIAAARIKVACSTPSFFNVSPTDFAVIVSVGVPKIDTQSTLATVEDQPITISLGDIRVTDEDSSYPEDFTLNISAGNNYSLDGLMIAPAADFNGELSVSISVNDGYMDSPSFPLAVTVTAVNDAPIIEINSGDLSVDEDNALSLDMSLLSIADVDSSDFTLTVTEGNNYAFDGTTITPDKNYNGTLTVSVKVDDGELESNSVTLNVIVNPINDAPLATDDAFSVEEYSSNNSFNLLANDSDVDTNDQLEITSISFTGSGTIYLANNGLSATYTPAAGFSGTEYFTYTISDTAGATATATGRIAVNSKSNIGGSSLSGLGLLFLALIALRIRSSKHEARR